VYLACVFVHDCFVLAHTCSCNTLHMKGNLIHITLGRFVVVAVVAVNKSLNSFISIKFGLDSYIT
jgi:hypothetical protein